MDMKKLILMFVLAMANFVYAQDQDTRVFWTDSHGIINVELAASKQLQDPNDFIARVVQNYDGLVKAGVINGRKAEEFGIRNHVDFCDYLLGYWDTDYSEVRPGSAKAVREDDADIKLENLWANAQSAMKLHLELMENPRYIRVSGIEIISEILGEMSDFELNHDCSPSVRIANYERRHNLMKFMRLNGV